ncbi:MAG: protein-disulfide reductase DsbD family protein [Methylibium sp.]
MKPLIRLAGLLVALPLSVLAQPSVVTTDYVRAELVAHAPDGVAPGKAVWLGLSIQHQPDWHSYWKNPGDSGLPTRLGWSLPSGVQAGEIEWPTPKRLPLGPLMNYGYDDKVLLPVSLAIPEGFTGPTLDVKLKADWLVCKHICVPESGEFSLRVPAQAATVGHAALFADARSRLPETLEKARGTAHLEGQRLVVEISGLPPASAGQTLQLFPETAGVIDPAAMIEQQWMGDRWLAKVPLSAHRSASPAEMHAVLVAAGQPAGMRVRLDIAGPWPTVEATPAPTPVTSGASDIPPQSGAPFVAAMGLALLGGLLLNLMPCVFPVLSLKVLGFARAGQRRRTVIAGGLAYTVGVIVSFVALAGLLLGLRAGGEQLGWGFQLQSPFVVAALAVLFTLIGLNLAGVFEFTSVLPDPVATWRIRHPVADHALTGALAVAVASPCTAPFMGAALGAALTLPATQALTVFAALGLGMSLPYLAASVLPGFARRLPRPGAWMQHFRVFLAFPMFATVVWLVWVLGHQSGVDAAAGLLAVLVAIALLAWSVGSAHLGRKGRLGFGSVAVLALAAALAWAWPALDPALSTAVGTPAQGRWQAWSPGAVAQAQAQGRPVFVDFTAAWCVTCQLNKRTTLSDPDVLADFERRQVVLLRADWTRRDPAITQELARLGRSGVPVYALYSPTARGPLVLPEILRAQDLHQALAGVADVEPVKAAAMPAPSGQPARSNVQAQSR